MSSFYDGLANTATKLLKKYGQVLKFTRTVAGAYDPLTGSYGSGSDLIFKGYGAVLSYKSIELNDSIVSGDLKLLVEDMKKVPQVHDTVTLASGAEYLVVAVKATNPAGTNVMTECQIRVGQTDVVR